MASEFISGFSVIFIYFVACASCALLMRSFFDVPKELFRKTLHIILLFSLLVWIYAFQTWWVSALAALALIVVVFPALSFAERFSGYSDLLTERKKGELKKSMVLVFGMFFVIICICWGWLDDKLLALACVYAWGFGDAAAALVGKRFGRHFLEGRLIEGRKSLEGTLAMFFVSLLSVAILLLIRGGLPWQGCLTIAAISAAVCATVELFTVQGFDTVTCPLAAVAVIIPLVHLWEGGIL